MPSRVDSLLDKEVCVTLSLHNLVDDKHRGHYTTLLEAVVEVVEQFLFCMVLLTVRTHSPMSLTKCYRPCVLH